MDTLNRSAIVVAPKQPFLERLHAADPTSGELRLSDLREGPTVYLIPECDTAADVEGVLRKCCKDIFEEQLGSWKLVSGTRFFKRH